MRLCCEVSTVGDRCGVTSRSHCLSSETWSPFDKCSADSRAARHEKADVSPSLGGKLLQLLRRHCQQRLEPWREPCQGCSRGEEEGGGGQVSMCTSSLRWRYHTHIAAALTGRAHLPARELRKASSLAMPSATVVGWIATSEAGISTCKWCAGQQGQGSAQVMPATASHPGDDHRGHRGVAIGER